MKSISISLVIVACLVVIFSVIRGQNELVLSDQAYEDGVVSSIPDANQFQEEEDEPLNGERFIPSHEWQVVKKNQAIPAGLHVRMNFETGIREAKLLDEDDRGRNFKGNQDQQQKAKDKVRDALNKNRETDKQNTGPKIILADDILNGEGEDFLHEKLVFKKSHLKHVLHNFKDKIGTKDIEHVTWSDDAKDALKETLDLENNVEKKKKEFRSMEEIKADLQGSMGWNIKSDVQIMQDIVEILQSHKTTREEIITALDSLEDYAHQIDNGKDLEKIGGLKLIVNFLNNSDEVLQEKAANVIGAAAQSNKEVQEAVYNHGGLNFLIRMLDNSKQTLTQKKGLYAVSAVLRNDRHVQNEFVKLGGLTSILRIIKQSTVTSLKVKAVTLLYDLIVEQEEVIQRMIQTGKKKASERSPLLISLIEAGWCEGLIPLLKTKDFDAKEKVIQAIVVSVKSCSETLNKHLTDFKHELKVLEDNIKTEDDKDFKEYLVSLKEQLDNNVITKLQQYQLGSS